jgi:hypothetical protein
MFTLPLTYYIPKNLWNNIYPRVIPKIPNTAGKTGGAGTGNFIQANIIPVTKPVASEAND